MKRSPLGRGKPPQRKTPMPRSPGPTVKRPATSTAELDARRLVVARSGGVCELDGMDRATDYAHRVGRAHGGAWCPSNAGHLCRAHHAWSHAYPVEARRLGWLLRSTDDPLVVPVRHWLHGLVLLTPGGGFQPADEQEDVA